MSRYRDDLPSGALHHMMGFLDEDHFKQAAQDFTMGYIKHPDNPDGEPNVLAGDEVTLDDLEEVYNYYCYNYHCELTWNQLFKNRYR